MINYTAIELLQVRINRLYAENEANEQKIKNLELVLQELTELKTRQTKRIAYFEQAINSYNSNLITIQCQYMTRSTASKSESLISNVVGDCYERKKVDTALLNISLELDNAKIKVQNEIDCVDGKISSNNNTIDNLRAQIFALRSAG